MAGGRVSDLPFLGDPEAGALPPGEDEAFRSASRMKASLETNPTRLDRLAPAAAPAFRLPKMILWLDELPRSWKAPTSTGSAVNAPRPPPETLEIASANLIFDALSG